MEKSHENVEGFCPVHNVEMEWIDDDHQPGGGFWFCQECYDDEIEGPCTKEPSAEDIQAKVNEICDCLDSVCGLSLTLDVRHKVNRWFDDNGYDLDNDTENLAWEFYNWYLD